MDKKNKFKSFTLDKIFVQTREFFQILGLEVSNMFFKQSATQATGTGLGWRGAGGG